MTIEFKVDNLGDGVKSADVAALHVAAGDVIQAGQIVVELETDKAVMEVPCPHAGMIGKLLVKKGDTVLPGQAIFEMEPTTASGGSLNGGTRSSPVTAVANAPSKVVTAVRMLPAVTRGSSLPLPAGPAAARLKQGGCGLLSVSQRPAWCSSIKST